MISRTTRSFWKLFDALSADVQHQTECAYVLWRGNLGHRSLQLKCVSERHQVYSVRIGLHWRALGYRDRVSDEDVLTWFWIGSHADYDRLIAGY